MKQFLSGSARDEQAKRLSKIEDLSRSFVDELDYKEGLKRSDVVKMADSLVKLVKKAKKVFLRGGFVDYYELAHTDEPPFAGPSGQPIPEIELNDNFRMATIKRPKTRQLKVKK